jgi:parallel beta-helix repeat protein
MKLTRKKAIAALMSMAAAGALGSSGFAQDSTFGGMPTVTPQTAKKIEDARRRDAATTSTKKRKLPAYVVVDQGGPNINMDRAADPSRARYTSINEAIENVAWGGVVVVMPGIYEENIELKRSVSLQGDRGAGSGVRIRQVAETNTAGEQKPCLKFTPQSFNEHAQVSNIDFEPMANAGVPCVDVKDGIFTMIQSSVKGGGGELVSIEGGTAFLEKNTISGGSTGISITQTHPLWDRATLVDNIVTENYHQGINLSGEASMLVTGNLVNTNGVGISYNGGGAATLVGNKILNNSKHGIELGEDGKEVLIRLNQIWSNDQDGIKVTNSTGLIEDNDIDGNGGFEVSTIGHLNTVPTIINDVAQNVSSPAYNRNSRRSRDQSQWRVGNGPSGSSR